MGREVVVAATEGRLDFGTWEQIFYAEIHPPDTLAAETQRSTRISRTERIHTDFLWRTAFRPAEVPLWGDLFYGTV